MANTTDINGKEIVFREKLPAADWWSVLPVLAGMATAGSDVTAILARLDLDTVVKMIQGTIESWELEADLDDPDSIKQLDIFTDMIPILTVLGEEIGRRTADLGK